MWQYLVRLSWGSLPVHLTVVVPRTQQGREVSTNDRKGAPSSRACTDDESEMQHHRSCRRRCWALPRCECCRVRNAWRKQSSSARPAKPLPVNHHHCRTRILSKQQTLRSPSRKRRKRRKPFGRRQARYAARLFEYQQ